MGVGRPCWRPHPQPPARKSLCAEPCDQLCSQGGPSHRMLESFPDSSPGSWRRKHAVGSSWLLRASLRAVPTAERGLGLLCSEPIVPGCHTPCGMAPRGRAAPAEPVPAAQGPGALATFTDGPHLMLPDDAGRRMRWGLESRDTCASSLSTSREGLHARNL